MKTNGFRWLIIMVVATVASMIGVSGWLLLFPKSRFGLFSFIDASCITWLILGFRLRIRRSIVETTALGLFSPFLGSTIVTAKILVLGGISASSIGFGTELLTGAMNLIVKTWWITLPVGVLTAFAVRKIWEISLPNHWLDQPAAR